MSDKDYDLDSLVRRTTEEYGIDASTAENDIVKFVDKLRESGLLDE